MTHSDLSLADGQRLLGMNDTELWTRYVALGGDRTMAQMREHVDGDRCSDEDEHNVIAQALNEVFIEQGRDHPVAYRHLYHHDAGA